MHESLLWGNDRVLLFPDDLRVYYRWSGANHKSLLGYRSADRYVGISYLMRTKKQLDVYVGRKHITRKKKQQK